MTILERARSWMTGDPGHLPGTRPPTEGDDLGADPGAAVDLAAGYHPGGCSCGCTGTGLVGADASTAQFAGITAKLAGTLIDPATVGRNLSGSPRTVAVGPADWDTIAIRPRPLDQSPPPTQTGSPHLPGQPLLPTPLPFD